jgi:hypothetical protein
MHHPDMEPAMSEAPKPSIPETQHELLPESWPLPLRGRSALIDQHDDSPTAVHRRRAEAPTRRWSADARRSNRI